MKTKTPWLKAKIIGADVSAALAKQDLLELIKQTGYVDDPKALISAVEERDKTVGAQIRENIFVYHAATPAVNHLCAATAVCVEGDKKTAYALVAYKQKNYFCLKRLAALLEAILDLTGATQKSFFAKKTFSTSQEFTNCLEDFFKGSGISIFDKEADEDLQA